MFNSLRLSVVVTVEVLADVLADVLVDITADVVVAAEAVTEILVEIKAMDADCKNLYIISTQSLIKSICALLLHQELASKYYLQYYPYL